MLMLALFIFIATSASAQVLYLQNRWKQTYLSGVTGAPTLVSGQPAGTESWLVEMVPFTGYIKLKHLKSGMYLHAQLGSLELGAAQSQWKGAMWSMEVVGAEKFIRFKNRLTGTYLHCEYGSMQLGRIEPGWWSAMWKGSKGTYVNPDPVLPSFSFVNEDNMDGDPYNPSEAPLTWLTNVTRGWMGKLPNSTKLREMSLPGTHDSGALYGGAAAECQTWTIAEQLEAGIRYLDIRCRRVGNVFAIHHGAFYQRQGFGDVLRTITTFLRDNPTETVIIKVKEEHVAESGSASFAAIWNDYMSRYQQYFFSGANISPTLGQLRGKIFVVCNAACSGRGMHFNDMEYTQRRYKVFFYAHEELKDEDWATLPSKKKEINKYIDIAIANPDKWVENQLSGSTGMIPYDVARATNRSAYEYLGTRSGKKSLGILLMDFPGERLIYRIIKSNFDFGTNCRCPAKTYREETRVSWVEFRMPAAETGTSITIDPGTYRQSYGSTCYGIFWDQLRFTCDPRSCTWKKVSGNYFDKSNSSMMSICLPNKPAMKYVYSGRK